MNKPSSFKHYGKNTQSKPVQQVMVIPLSIQDLNQNLYYSN